MIHLLVALLLLKVSGCHFFLVVAILTLRNYRVVRFLGDSKLQTGPTQLTFLLAVAVILFLALWKLILYYFQMQKERIAKKIIYERERHALIKMYESTGDVLHHPQADRYSPYTISQQYSR